MVKKKVSKKISSKTKSVKAPKHSAVKKTSSHKIKANHKIIKHKETVHKEHKITKSQEKKDILTIIALSVLIVIIIVISIISGNNSNTDLNIDSNVSTDLVEPVIDVSIPVDTNVDVSVYDENLSYEEVLQKAMDLQLEMFSEIKNNQLAIFEGWYDELGIDSEEMNICLEENDYLNTDLNVENSKLISKIYKDIQLAQASGFTGTPGLFVNNYRIDGYKDNAYFDDLIQASKDDIANNISVSFTDEGISDFNANVSETPKLYVVYNEDYNFTKEYVDNMLNLLKQEPYNVFFDSFFEDVEVLKMDYKNTNEYMTNVLNAVKVNSLPFFYLDGDVDTLLEIYDENEMNIFNSLFAPLPVGGYMLAIPPQQVLDASILSDEEDYFYGQEDAPVTIYIFEDYDCTYCDKLDKEVLPEIITKYVDSGEVNIVVKDFVIYQTQSLFPTVFSRCAQRQNIYWDVHTKLFENRALFGGSLVQQITTKYADQISELQEQYKKFSE